MPTDIWPVIHAERQALAEDLAGLPDDRWETPSLCANWSVHDVVAHMLSGARMTPPKFFLRFAAAGLRFDHYIGRETARARLPRPAEMLAAFRAASGRTSSPPGPKTSWLGEALVHAEDIRRPLGIAHDYPMAEVTRTIAFYANSNAVIGGKSRVAGVTLAATDTDFTHGSGPRVEGPAMSLLLATSGRRVALEDLSGPGVDVLRARA